MSVCVYVCPGSSVLIVLVTALTIGLLVLTAGLVVLTRYFLLFQGRSQKFISGFLPFSFRPLFLFLFPFPPFPSPHSGPSFTARGLGS